MEMRWNPPPNGGPEPLKRHYQLYVEDATVEEAGEHQTRIALDCDKRRCVVAQKVEGLVAKGDRGDPDEEEA